MSNRWTKVARRSATALLLVCCASVGRAAGAEIRIGRVRAVTGEPASVCVELAGGGGLVAAVQMDLQWDSNCLEAAAGPGSLCRANPSTRKTVQSLVRGDSARVVMYSLADTAPIADGELFCCGFVGGEAPSARECSLRADRVIGSDSRGSRVAVGVAADTQVSQGSQGGCRLVARSGAGGEGVLVLALAWWAARYRGSAVRKRTKRPSNSPTTDDRMAI